MVKLRILRWENYSGFSGWALNAITSVPQRERQRGRSQEEWEKVMPREKREKWEWCRHKLKNASCHQKLEEARNGFSPSGCEAAQLCWHFDFSPGKLLQISGLQIHVCCLKAHYVVIYWHCIRKRIHKGANDGVVIISEKSVEGPSLFNGYVWG